jgi:NAD(P)-dependent dehydrogenase (short-subunit alcohol dehydrogenase family)
LCVTHSIGAGRNGQSGWLGGFCALALDISADGAVQATVDALLARVSTFDILVHCAGIMKTGSVEGMNLIDFDRAFEINVRSPYALTQAALPSLKVSRGRVLFVNSSIIRAANTAGRGFYAATQAALKAFADILRDEVNPCGVPVLSGSICIGLKAAPAQIRCLTQSSTWKLGRGNAMANANWFTSV